ncbi:MAG: S8 family serine peptidase, partial [Alphaproteobacteria bacterium]|nr:S8 family serine peptidase [Alphaproteobacteria bacterium]
MKNTPLMRFQTLAQLLALCAAVLLAGCGGGGGAPPEATAQVKTPPPPRYLPQIFVTAEEDAHQKMAQKFENSEEYMPRAWDKNGRTTKPSRQLAQINAAMAYARGATGKGEIVAVSDIGFYRDVQNEEFEDKIVYLGPGPGPGIGLVWNHGTVVSSLIAARRDEKGGIGNMHGVAFDAKLALRKTVSRLFRADLRFVTEKENKDVVRDVINLDYAREHGAAIANFSFSPTFRSYIHEYPEKVFTENFQYTVDYLAQKDTPAEDKIIVVWGAGNRGADSPSVASGFGVYFPELREHVLTVVAVDQKGKIAEFSNRCGIAEAFCLAAPGEDIVHANADKNALSRPASGTSLAAPLVSGGLALLRQYFRDDDGTRQLGNTELVSRLLATAYRGKVYEETPDEVDYSDSDIYGRGLMDLDAATKPYCSTGDDDDCMMTSLSTDPNAQPFNPAAFSLSGNAFGGA